MHQKSMIVDIIHWCWKVVFHREDLNNISEFTQQDDKKRGWQNACVWQAYDLRVLGWSSLKSMFSGLLQKDLFKGGWSSPQKFFKQNYCHACDIRFAVFFPLSSCCIKYTISRMWLYFYHYHSPLYPASRAFLSLTWFWCTHERLYISWVRTLLGMQCMLLGYSFKPRPNSHVLGTAGSVMHQFNNKWMLTCEKNRLVKENKIDSSPEAWAAVTSTGWHNSGRASLSPHSRRQKEAWLAGCLLWYPTTMKNYRPGHDNVCI